MFRHRGNVFLMEKHALYSSILETIEKKVNKVKFLRKKYMRTATRVTRLGDCSPIGLLLEAHYDFLKR